MNLLQKISKWIFSRGTLPYWCILVYDSITVIASGYFVYYLQHGFQNLVENISRVSLGIGICFAVYMIAFISRYSKLVYIELSYCFVPTVVLKKERSELRD